MMRRPLVVISPKSLLRNPNAVSDIDELTEGSFQYVIDDSVDSPEKVSKIIMCSGKVFYDLASKRDDLGMDSVAIIRIEQLYPFPYDTLEKILKTYKNVKSFTWCQEEPTNQGAWYNHRHRLQEVIDRLNLDAEIELVSREASSAPAVGLNKLHIQQQEALVIEALTKEK